MNIFKKRAASKARLLQQQNLLRTRHPSQATSFTSNDYLALGIGAQKSLSASASPLLGGWTKEHKKLEQEFCNYFKTEAALLFSSGYQANLSIGQLISYLTTHAICDSECHRSIWDGLLLAKTPFSRFSHNNQSAFLQKASKQKQFALCLERLYSMTGTITNLDAFIANTDPKNSLIIIDHAHSFGVLPMLPNYASHQLLHVIPLGKAMAMQGGIITGPHYLIDAILQSSSAYRYSTALSPLLAQAGSGALQKIITQSYRRTKLQSLVSIFNQLCIRHNISTTSDPKSPIKILPISQFKNIKTLTKKLQNTLPIIRPPTVPPHKEAFRITITLNHTPAQITNLIGIVAKYAPSP